MNKSYTDKDKIYHFIKDHKASKERLFWHIFTFWLGKKDYCYCDKCIFGNTFNNTLGDSKCANMYEMERYLR